MAEDRLKAELWLKAQIRLCDRDGIPATIVRRGDPTGGAILIKVNRYDAGCRVYTQVRDRDANPAWLCATGADPVAEADADAYIQRQVQRDYDLWVLEIEDPKARWALRERVIES
ncbi:MAG: DUF1491 family protein [Proteobacteria bacterium]|nr:DUF1491 family protein [Pseudomonadota bacterium]